MPDTFDLLPGMQLGLRIGEAAERRKEREAEQQALMEYRREILKERSIEAAALAEHRKRTEERLSEIAEFNQSKVFAELGVPPVIGQDGRVDVAATFRAGQQKAEADAMWQAFGAANAWKAKTGAMRPEDEVLARMNPQYLIGFQSQQAKRAEFDAKVAAELEQIRLRNPPEALNPPTQVITHPVTGEELGVRSGNFVQWNPVDSTVAKPLTMEGTDEPVPGTVVVGGKPRSVPSRFGRPWTPGGPVTIPSTNAPTPRRRFNPATGSLQ